MEFESFYTNQTSKQLVQQPSITARWASKKKRQSILPLEFGFILWDQKAVSLCNPIVCYVNGPW